MLLLFLLIKVSSSLETNFLLLEKNACVDDIPNCTTYTGDEKIYLASTNDIELSNEGTKFKLEMKNSNKYFESQTFYLLNSSDEVYPSRSSFSRSITKKMTHDTLASYFMSVCDEQIKYEENGLCELFQKSNDNEIFFINYGKHFVPDAYEHFVVPSIGNAECHYQFIFNKYSEEFANRVAMQVQSDGLEPRCYALKENGKCDGSLTLPPNAYAYRNHISSNSVIFDYETTLSVINKIEFSQPIYHDKIKVGQCISNFSITVKDEEYIYDFSGPTHYTSYNMNETTKTGIRYSWKSYSICMKTNRLIETNFAFKNDLHTISSVAYDPVFAFKKITKPPPSAPPLSSSPVSIASPSLPPPPQSSESVDIIFFILLSVIVSFICCVGIFRIYKFYKDENVRAKKVVIQKGMDVRNK